MDFFYLNGRLPWLTFLGAVIKKVSVISLNFTPSKIFFGKPGIASTYLKLHIKKFLQEFFHSC